MMSLTDLIRETRFLAKQGYVVGFLLVVFALTSFAIVSGVNEIREQQETLVRLQAKDATEREHILTEQHDYGSAAYYSFHLTYSEPQPLAFAAMGQRDVTSWKHRIRMLALEGQIYETDAQNPELSLAGFFDFAFIVSILLPLFVILLLHDLRAGEREAGRYDLLLVSAKRQGSLWAARALILCTGARAGTVGPLWSWCMDDGSAHHPSPRGDGHRACPPRVLGMVDLTHRKNTHPERSALGAHCLSFAWYLVSLDGGGARGQ